MPLVSFEEIEDALERRVWNLNRFAMEFFDLVTKKQTAIEIWYRPEQLISRG